MNDEAKRLIRLFHAALAPMAAYGLESREVTGVVSDSLFEVRMRLGPGWRVGHDGAWEGDDGSRGTGPEELARAMTAWYADRMRADAAKGSDRTVILDLLRLDGLGAVVVRDVTVDTAERVVHADWRPMRGDWRPCAMDGDMADLRRRLDRRATLL